MSDRFTLDQSGFDARLGTRLIHGPGTCDRTGVVARELALTHVLLVTDPSIHACGHADRVQRSLESAGLRVTVFSETTPEPTTADVARCLRRMVEAGSVDGLVAVGGGSCIDTAKGAAFLAENGGQIVDYRGFGKARRPLKPMIALPTTAGTGSEVQSFALIAEETGHRKIAFGDPSALPRVAILDPELTATQPRSVTAAAGLDTVVHAVETAVTRAGNDFSRVYAREAFRLATGSLPTVLDSPGDLVARGRMQLAACYAGLAIEHSMLGAAHSAANPLSARYGVIHGRAVAMTVVDVVAWNAEDPATAASYAALARSAGLATVSDADSTAVRALIETLQTLRSASGIPKPAEAGLVASDIPSLAQEAATQWTAAFNPRPIAAPEFARLYEKMLRA